MADVSIIIPQHGGSQLTLRAMCSLAANHSGNLQIVVIDDGSTLRDCRWLQTGLRETGALARVEIIRLPRRRGVTAAWNAGARAASGDCLVFLNNDTVNAGPWVTTLIAPLETGACGITGVGWRRELDWPHRIPPAQGSDNVLVGWCLALRRQTWSTLGGFDERFQLYYSDTDLQCRLLRGWTGSEPLRAIPGLPLAHLGHRSTRQLPTRADEWRKDRERFLRKWRKS